MRAQHHDESRKRRLLVLHLVSRYKQTGAPKRADSSHSNALLSNEQHAGTFSSCALDADLCGIEYQL